MKKKTLFGIALAAFLTAAPAANARSLTTATPLTTIDNNINWSNKRNIREFGFWGKKAQKTALAMRDYFKANGVPARAFRRGDSWIVQVYVFDNYQMDTNVCYEWVGDDKATSTLDPFALATDKFLDDKTIDVTPCIEPVGQPEPLNLDPISDFKDTIKQAGTWH